MQKKFKRTLSVMLAFALVLTAFCGIVPTSADVAADDGKIHATPIVESSWARLWQYCSQEVVTAPVANLTTANGRIFDNKKNGESYKPNYNQYASNGIHMGFQYTATDGTNPVYLTGATHLIFYIKTDVANVIAPAFNAFIDGATTSKDFYLNVGADYSIKALNDANWTTKQAVQAKENETRNAAGVVFDSAFEGFVKISLDSFSNSNASLVFSPNEDKFETFIIRAQKFGEDLSGNGGEDYGPITLGPVMKVTQDSSAVDAIIEVPDEYAPAKQIAATPLSYTSVQSHAGKTEVTPIPEFTTSTGYTFSPTSQYTYDYPASKNYYAAFNYDGTVMASSTAILFYVEVTSANKIAPSFNASKSGTAREYHLNVGKDYSIKAISSKTWTDKKTVKGHETSNTWRAAIELEEGFKGWVKIPLASFSNDGGVNFTPDTDTFNQFCLRFSKYGGSYGPVTFGPVMKVTADTPYYIATIEIPDSYKPSMEIKATPITETTYARNWKYSSYTIQPSIPSITNANSMTFTAKSYSGSDYIANYFGYASSSSNYVGMNYGEGVSLSGSTALIFYFETEVANIIAPAFDAKVNGNSKNFYLSIGSDYYIKELNGDWVKGTAVDTSSDSSDQAGVTLDAAFKGFIKIPLSSLTGTFNADADLITQFVVRAQKFGKDFSGTTNTDYGTLTFGPLMKVTTDSTYEKAPIIVPKEYQSQPVDGDMNGDYLLNNADIAELRKAILNSSTDSKFDYDKDSFINVIDLLKVKKLVKQQ